MVLGNTRKFMTSQELYYPTYYLHTYFYSTKNKHPTDFTSKEIGRKFIQFFPRPKQCHTRQDECCPTTYIIIYIYFYNSTPHHLSQINKNRTDNQHSTKENIIADAPVVTSAATATAAPFAAAAATGADNVVVA